MKTVTKLPSHCALLIIDMQNGFCAGGGLAVAGGDEIVPLINTLQQRFEGNAIFATHDWHPADHKSFAVNHPGAAPYDEVMMPYGPQRLWPTHCIENTADAALHPQLDLNPQARIIRKGTNRDVDSYSAFLEVDKKSYPRFADGTTLAAVLKAEGKKTLVLCGLAYDFCVGFSALDARAAGFDVVVVKDATRAVAIPIGPDATTATVMDQQLKEAGVIVIDNIDQLPQALPALPNKTAAVISRPQPR